MNPNARIRVKGHSGDLGSGTSQYKQRKPLKTVDISCAVSKTPVKWGVNETRKERRRILSCTLNTAEKTVENGWYSLGSSYTPLKRGVNETGLNQSKKGLARGAWVSYIARSF